MKMGSAIVASGKIIWDSLWILLSKPLIPLIVSLLSPLRIPLDPFTITLTGGTRHSTNPGKPFLALTNVAKLKLDQTRFQIM